MKLELFNIELQTVNYEQAQELHKLGFPSEVIGITGLEDFECSYISPPENCLAWANNTGIKHPSLELVAKFLREEKGIVVNPAPTCRRGELALKYEARVITGISEKGLEGYWQGKKYNTFEEALSAGIDKAIEILKSK